MIIPNDLLYYYHKNSGASDEKREGITIAIISILMRSGFSYENALGHLKFITLELFEAKNELDEMNVVLPKPWIEDFNNA